MLHKLRIAFTSVCGIVCLLLIVLWVRSQSNTEKLFLQYDATRGLRVIVGAGRIQIEPSAERLWIETSTGFSTSTWIEPTHSRLNDEPTTFDFATLSFDAAKSAPLWCPVLSLAASAAIPWLRWRFSLRTLLIATTLVAFVLGAIVYAAK
jgi:hypothetical protein